MGSTGPSIQSLIHFQKRYLYPENVCPTRQTCCSVHQELLHFCGKERRRCSSSSRRQSPILHQQQIQVDRLLHPLLWQRSFHPLPRHETSTSQEINFLL